MNYENIPHDPSSYDVYVNNTKILTGEVIDFKIILSLSTFLSSSYNITLNMFDGTMDVYYSISVSIIENYALLINIFYPNGGEILSGLIAIYWNASDSLGNQLTYSIYYSNDAGVSWNEINKGLTFKQFSWDTTTVNDGANYLLKIEASDGVIISEDLTDGLFSINNGKGTNPTNTNASSPSLDVPSFKISISLLGLMIPILINRKKELR